jgi:hypothetical protein
MQVPLLHAHRALHRRSLRPVHRSSAKPATSETCDPEVRAARAVTALVALATGLLFVLLTLAALGCADAAWWPAAVIVAMSLVAALAAWILARAI